MPKSVELREILELQDLQVGRAHVDLMEREENLEIQDHPVLRVLRVMEVLMVRLVSQEKTATTELLVKVAQVVNKVHKEHQDHADLLDWMVCLASKEIEVNKDKEVKREIREDKENREHEEKLVEPDEMDYRARWEFEERPVPKVPQENKV